MFKFTFSLLVVFVVSVVSEWQENSLVITNDDCVRTINRLLESYNTTINDSPQSFTPELQEKLAVVLQDWRKQLLDLIPLAKQQKPFEAYRHELRVFNFDSNPIYCSRELSYKITTICNTATQKAISLKFRESLPQVSSRLKNSEKKSNERNQVSEENDQLLTRGIQLSNSIINKNRDDDERSNKKIMKELGIISLHIKAIEAEIREIRRTLTAKTPDKGIEKTEISLLKDFPVTSKAALNKVEHRLLTDPNYLNELVKALAIFLQNGVKSTVTKLMHKIMSNSVAVHYSFHEEHEKMAFKKMRLYNVLLRVIRLRFNESLVSDDSVNDCVQSWLRHAPGRVARLHRNDASGLEDVFDSADTDAM